ncbi:hypothetical protein T265_05128 [Opisthorchis viverrini]|uniref:Uncharacterized protein n=1 Tax=Opisthorchis viverrini TaxID=6198 RepID=A0A074ZKQ9_OPIVI|nr:hypothetical protein T265_05128 [Opisthorchis viverrini]KER27923.1 hypothetical protein T265_05128 [Opisthorchis viverrini]
MPPRRKVRKLIATLFEKTSGQLIRLRTHKLQDRPLSGRAQTKRNVHVQRVTHPQDHHRYDTSRKQLISSAYPMAMAEPELRASDMRRERVVITPPAHGWTSEQLFFPLELRFYVTRLWLEKARQFGVEGQKLNSEILVPSAPRMDSGAATADKPGPLEVGPEFGTLSDPASRRDLIGQQSGPKCQT